VGDLSGGRDAMSLLLVAGLAVLMVALLALADGPRES